MIENVLLSFNFSRRRRGRNRKQTLGRRRRERRRCHRGFARQRHFASDEVRVVRQLRRVHFASALDRRMFGRNDLRARSRRSEAASHLSRFRQSGHLFPCRINRFFCGKIRILCWKTGLLQMNKCSLIIRRH